MGYTVTIADGITAKLQEVRKQLAGVNQVFGQAAAQLTQQHIAKLDATRANALGGDRSHFYEQAAKATSFQVMLDGVQIRVDYLGFAQRYYGGTIKPVNASRLTIPARAEAYNHRAGDFDDLHYVHFASGAEALVRNYQQGVKFGKRGARAGKEMGGEVYYWLVPEVTQEPDHSVIPTDAEYEAALDDAIENLLLRK